MAAGKFLCLKRSKKKKESLSLSISGSLPSSKFQKHSSCGIFCDNENSFSALDIFGVSVIVEGEIVHPYVILIFPVQSQNLLAARCQILVAKLYCSIPRKFPLAYHLLFFFFFCYTPSFKKKVFLVILEQIGKKVKMASITSHILC
jgi:hypothetical protein